ncbi:LacI family DNA-binding transcriptional regulator [Roseibium denhamense]|uniref:Transcriptional regulator, LacI family n=1 Tax=Roseibium denhamense TaxID=76305 RepID=A0ABY1NBN4_9HYPH|nr:LacI family DNA-binding transcriptional regulator [Roseibium denhamense]MTI06621.1 LacI family DNA-binding transcriptional regulator [Roseibium denhamense]SMP05775.1 transcriptional regulator, LacI family [Roseibium denhamense]
MPGEKVTSVDVAKRAGVSQSAVSRVFTQGASVSPKMAEKVHKAAQELGYRPNVLARSLITGRSKIIGLVVAYLENQFYPDALEKLSNALQAHGYHILVFMVSNEDASVDKVMGELLDYQVDGIITASVGMSNDLAARCAAAGVPVVLFNRGQDDDRLNQVTSNNFEGGRQIAKFLAASGHERIAHIAGWSGSSTGRDREAGFRVGLKDAGLELCACIDGMYKRETAAAAAIELFSGSDRPDAVFVGNDHMAFAVMDVLRFELKLDVPGDVSVVGYDDVPLASWPAYDLTTLRQPSNRMVEATVATLLGWIEDGSTSIQKIQIDGPLMVRGSARIPQGWNDERL